MDKYLRSLPTPEYHDNRRHLIADQFNLILGDPEQCMEDQPLDILIIVKSAASYANARQQIRQTWAHPDCIRHVLLKIRIVFVLGIMHETAEATALQPRIEQEYAVYRDILQFDFVDHYRNNTYKFICAMEFAANSCSVARYVVVVDDDFLIYPANLVRYLERVTAKEYPVFVAGHVFYATVPVRQPNHKWCLTQNEYPFSFFPPYPTGGTIMLSMPLVKRLSVQIRYVPYLSIDDVVLGLVLRKLRIGLKHTSGIYLRKLEYLSLPEEKLISVHSFRDLQHIARSWSTSFCRSNITS
ncbi:uncharacterized protein DEA37_0014732 [Paragonimus westermani]|uniref:Hexosyltransferase n=1 Tax=Paragonimus westermani TaxID=34504 RepID=A0A5J4N397_9TREM|nr:uncharacterized protein DEA37_0003846 [Paragonimus westermani]KAA3671112.1 uncharacterized protein DEA37_0014732 [Paragonimus westermani]